jgi:2'-phosphotransferase
MEKRQDGWWIRANQGHSFPVKDLDLVKITAEDVENVIHGTYIQNWNSIKTQGLSIMSRQYIHCTTALPDEGKTVQSGKIIF